MIGSDADRRSAHRAGRAPGQACGLPDSLVAESGFDLKFCGFESAPGRGEFAFFEVELTNITKLESQELVCAGDVCLGGGCLFVSEPGQGGVRPIWEHDSDVGIQVSLVRV